MKPQTFLLSLISAASVGAAPFALKRADDRGSYEVSGLGPRKQEILKAGGSTLDIAIAMLESDTMQADYAYGDNKSGDAANFGIFKQNWGLLRECSKKFQGRSAEEFNDGAVLNTDLDADIQARADCVDFYGETKWFAGHRNGATGLSNTDTEDINNYKTAVYWIQEQIDSDAAHKSDDIRFWVDVVAI
ncbi:hypothetical protein MBLNU13_g04768t1 [Cladosporium sp. NU13]